MVRCRTLYRSILNRAPTTQYRTALITWLSTEHRTAPSWTVLQLHSTELHWSHGWAQNTEQLHLEPCSNYTVQNCIDHMVERRTPNSSILNRAPTTQYRTALITWLSAEHRTAPSWTVLQLHSTELHWSHGCVQNTEQLHSELCSNYTVQNFIDHMVERRTPNSTLLNHAPTPQYRTALITWLSAEHRIAPSWTVLQQHSTELHWSHGWVQNTEQLHPEPSSNYTVQNCIDSMVKRRTLNSSILNRAPTTQYRPALIAWLSAEHRTAPFWTVLQLHSTELQW